MFTVYQIHLTDVDADYVNSVGWGVAYDTNPNVRAYLDARDEKFDAAFDSGAYRRVATIDAVDLDDVFRIGNIGPEELITRHGRMHSVSVGDVIRDPNGDYFAVAGFGFTPVGVSE